MDPCTSPEDAEHCRFERKMFDLLLTLVYENLRVALSFKMIWIPPSLPIAWGNLAASAFSNENGT
jgi:hypothetical protein